MVKSISEPRMAYYLVAGGCLAFYTWMALGSMGFVEPDEMSHFMKSMDMTTNWHFVLDIWGRPFCVAYYGIGVTWGIHLTRLLSVLASALTAVGTVRLAQTLFPDLSDRFPHHKVFLWLLLLAQPYFMMQSFSVMTEILLAGWWVWAAVALAGHRPLLAGVCIGFGGLTRPEGSIAVAVWLLFLLFFRHDLDVKKWPLIKSSMAAAAPSLIWWLVGAGVFGGPDWFVRHWPWAVQSVYGRTPVEAVLAVLNAFNFWMIVPAGLGIYAVIRGKDGWDVGRPAKIFLISPLISVFVLHFLLGFLGLFGSLSLPRYYVTVAPFIAIVTLVGWLYLYRSIASKIWSQMFLAILLILVPSRAWYMADRGDLPFPKSCDQIKLDRIMTWYMSNRDNTSYGMDPRPENIIAAHPYVNYIFTGSSNTPGSLRLFAGDGIRSAPAGTVVLCEDGVWKKNGFPTEEQLIGWNYHRIDDPDLSRVLAEACEYDPVDEDMKLFVKR